MQTQIPGGATGDSEFDDARLRAMFGAIADRLTHRNGELVSFSAILERIQVRGQHMLGLQSVPLDHIVGSEGRSSDFDRNFLPRTQRTKDRWKRVLAAHYAGVTLPPIDLLKLGEVYFVRDGNHRVSVARRMGQREIDAYVAELETDTPLEAGLTTRDLPYVEEQSDFLEWTGLAQVPAATPIRVTRLGGYLDLICHINGHRVRLREERCAEISREEAVADWYAAVYLPVLERLRAADAHPSARHETDGDRFLHVLRHQAALSCEGLTLPLVQAAEDYIALHSARRAWLGRRTVA